MGQACCAKAHLGDFKPHTFAHDDPIGGQFHVLVNQFAMATVFFGAHDRDAAVDTPTRIVPVMQKGRQTAAWIIRSARQKDKVVGIRSAGDEPLVPADDILVALFRGCGGHHSRIGSAAGMRLGHYKRRPHIAPYDRVKPTLFLFGRSGLFEHHHVAVIRCGRVEDHRPENRPVHLFVTDRHANPAQLLPACFGFELQTPKPFVAGLFAQWRHPVIGNIVVLIPGLGPGFDRQDFVRDKAGNARAIIFDAGGNGKVHKMSSNSQSDETRWPPSATTSVPVMKWPRSETSSKSGPSRSEGWPRRRCGTRRISA